MAKKARKKANSGIRVSMSCLAEFVTSYGRSAESRLRPYKFNKRGEGFARSSYYQYALRTIRAYHSQGNDPTVFERDVLEMRARADKATEDWERAKFERNISAVEAYRRIYGNRKFNILPNRRLEYRIGGIVVTAQSDLWAEEQGTQVLLKIGMARHKISYVLCGYALVFASESCCERWLQDPCKKHRLSERVYRQRDDLLGRAGPLQQYIRGRGAGNRRRVAENKDGYASFRRAKRSPALTQMPNHTVGQRNAP